MEEKLYYLDFATLENFMRDVFVAVGVPAADAATCAEVLITALDRGDLNWRELVNPNAARKKRG